jgi:predicted enzyme related to lactoylglutathione lyase
MAMKTKSRARKATRTAKPAAKPAAKKAPAKAAKKAPAKKAASPETKASTWSPPTGAGTFCWNELMTTDVAGAKAFYGALFGWTSQAMGTASTGEYTVFSRGKDGVAGLQLVHTERDGGRSHWLPSVLVDDVDAIVASASNLGATVLQRPTDVPGMGRYAVLRDPQGAHVSLWKSAQG